MGDCVDPKAVPAGALAMYALDPTENAQITQHLTICSACTKEVDAMQALNERLTARLARFDCPPTEHIDAYAAHVLAPVTQATLAAHLLNCARCTEEVRLAALFLSEGDPLLDWQSPGIMPRIRRLLATLQLPSVGASPAMALRGAQVNAPLTYTTEDVTLTLRYIKEQQPPRLLGFIDVQDDATLLEQPIPVRVLVLVADGISAPDAIVQTAAEDGAFELAPIPAGTYTLEVDLPDRQVVVAGIVLG